MEDMLERRPQLANVPAGQIWACTHLRPRSMHVLTLTHVRGHARLVGLRLGLRV